MLAETINLHLSRCRHIAVKSLGVFNVSKFDLSAISKSHNSQSTTSIIFIVIGLNSLNRFFHVYVFELACVFPPWLDGLTCLPPFFVLLSILKQLKERVI